MVVYILYLRAVLKMILAWVGTKAAFHNLLKPLDVSLAYGASRLF